MSDLQVAFARILRPLVRVLIARGVRYPAFSEWVKRVYLSVAERDFKLDRKQVTDSRIHLLTGLQRKDIKALRARAEEDTAPASAGPLPRIVGAWLADHSDAAGAPLALPRQGDAPSFEALVRSVSKDMHARTVMDELLRLGAVTAEADRLVLNQEAFLPVGDDAALLGYLGANLGDHAEAAARNVLAAPLPGPHFERAVHYNGLTPAALDELDRLSRELLGEALTKVNGRAAALQRRDSGKEDATGRYRGGAFVFTQAHDEEPT